MTVFCVSTNIGRMYMKIYLSPDVSTHSFGARLFRRSYGLFTYKMKHVFCSDSHSVAVDATFVGQ